MMKRQVKKDTLSHIMVNVLDFWFGNPIEIAITKCVDEKINNLVTMYKN